MIGSLPAQLRDIHDLDPAPWWPLAPGWWLVILGLLLLIALTVVITRALIRNPIGSWRRDARARLLDLRRRQRGQSPKQTGAELSELLRRISIARFGRARCAGLSGEAWLDWLSATDPKGFDWSAKGRVLIQLPYAPETETPDAGLQLSNLINAALELVAHSSEDATRVRRRWHVRKGGLDHV